MALNIKQVDSDQGIQGCFDVMVQLRPHLTAAAFVDRVRSQMPQGYRLACVLDNDTVVAVAGYRFAQSLSWGRYLYVDDLITDEGRRSEGFGKALLDWLKQEARRHDCEQFHLDSGCQRKDAHRFYEREGMAKLAYHFACAIE